MTKRTARCDLRAVPTELGIAAPRLPRTQSTQHYHRHPHRNFLRAQEITARPTHARAASLPHAQQNGHHLADLDPLGILNADLSGEIPVQCTLNYNGFNEEDLDLDVSRVPGVAKFFGESEGSRKYTLGDVVTRLEELYGSKSTIGWDFMHIQEVERCDWIRDKIERPGASFPFVDPRNCAL